MVIGGSFVSAGVMAGGGADEFEADLGEVGEEQGAGSGCAEVGAEVPGGGEKQREAVPGKALEVGGRWGE